MLIAKAITPGVTMATEVVKRLVEGKLIETKAAEAVAQRLRQR